MTKISTSYKLKAKSSVISIKNVKHVAKLAQLPLTNEEIKKFQTQLSDILEYINQLQEVDTKGIEETSQVTGLVNVFKENKVKKCLTSKEALSNAKQTHNKYFKVPGILNN